MSRSDAVQSFYWFDYETFGRSPRWDRPAQFAGQRTDLDLQPIGEPDSFHCRLSDDYLPDPGACRITGISPDTVQRHGLCEARFIERVQQHLGAPGTISVGYNSIAFDDEFTRHTLFRNLHDPYAWAWKNGSSRWDLLDVMRLTRALRPEGLQWPTDAQGRPVNTLEALAAANGVGHERAHDALSDVQATIGLARAVRTAQPRLFDWLLEHRGKREAAELLDLTRRKPVLLATGRIPRERHHLAVVVPICPHPTKGSGTLVLDLHTDPDEWVSLDVDALRHRLFSRRDELGEQERIGLFPVKLNACPVLAPLATLGDADAQRLGMDKRGIAHRHARLLELLDGAPGASLIDRLHQALVREWPADSADVDGSLYGGGFLSSSDRQRLEQLRERLPDEAGPMPAFDDPRLPEQVFRYRARNWPESLDEPERARWHHQARARLMEEPSPWLTFDRFERAVDETDWLPDQAPLARSLRRWGDALGERVGRRRADRQAADTTG